MYHLDGDPRIKKVNFSYQKRNSMGLPDRIDAYSMIRKDGSQTTQHYCTFDVDAWEIDQGDLQSDFLIHVLLQQRMMCGWRSSMENFL